MDLQRIAETEAVRTWGVLARIYTRIGAIPKVVINKRLKTTAGWCYHERRIVELSAELMEHNLSEFGRVIIPHELAHQVDWDVYQRSGHGPTWKGIMVRMGLPPDRCHNLINPLHEARKAARLLK